jgi:hypothetical protein
MSQKPNKTQLTPFSGSLKYVRQFKKQVNMRCIIPERVTHRFAKHTQHYRILGVTLDQSQQTKKWQA